MNIVGIAGLPRSGKDTLAELFMKQGYFGVSFGDIFRDVSRQRHADKPDPLFHRITSTISNACADVRLTGRIVQIEPMKTK